MRTNNARTATRLEPERDASQVPAMEREPGLGAEGGAISQIVSRALSLKPRGAVGNDGLIVRNLSARLRVHLIARPIHPWDRDRPANERNELFVQQCLEDVSIAIPKLFRSMPELDELEAIVLDPKGKKTVISGVVKRADALSSSGFSAGMKLRSMGLVFARSNSGFERLDESLVVIPNTMERASHGSSSQK